MSEDKVKPQCETCFHWALPGAIVTRVLERMARVKMCPCKVTPHPRVYSPADFGCDEYKPLVR